MSPCLHVMTLSKNCFGSRPGVAADGRARNGRRGGHMIGRGGFIDRSHHKPVSAEDLDADLDKYHSDAMHIK